MQRRVRNDDFSAAMRDIRKFNIRTECRRFLLLNTLAALKFAVNVKKMKIVTGLNLLGVKRQAIAVLMSAYSYTHIS